MKVIDNRFRIDKFLEDGQKSNLYLATDLWNLEKTYKLRFYDEDEQKDIINHFINEFISISKIRHKNLLSSEKFNIVKCVDGQKLNLNWYYSVIEYIDSPTLEDVINDLSFSEKLFIFIQILIVVDYLHFKGIVYKYLSPTNIFVTNNCIIKLKDLATIYEKDFEKNYDNIDSYFIAPEILIDTENIDKRVDYYSISRLLKYIFEDNFYKNIRCPFILNERYKIDREKVSYLEELYRTLIRNSQIIDDINLHEIILEIIHLFNIDYKYDIVKERNNLNFRTKIVGREDEIREILDIDNQLNEGKLNYKLALIEGREGLGKTRLLEEINHLLTFKGRTVYYLPIDDDSENNFKLTRRLLRETIKDTDKNLLDKYGGEFKKIVPELNYPVQITSSTNLFEYKERYRFYHRIKNYLEELSTINPIYIIIDNIHNIDEWSIGLINYFINSLEEEPIMLIASFDSKAIEKESIQYQLIEKWYISDKVKNIRLSKLGLKEIGEFVQYILGISEKPLNFSTALLSESLGNPNYIELIIKNLFATEQLYINENGKWYINANDYNELHYSTSFDEVLNNQIKTLNIQQRKVIKIISIFKFPVTKNILLQMLNVSMEKLEEIIKELVLLNFIEERLGDWGYSYTIYSLNLKRKIYSNIGEEERNKLHKKAAEICRANLPKGDMNSLEELTYHLSRSNQVKEAIDYLIEEAKSLQPILDTYALHLWHLAYQLLEVNKVDYRRLEINEYIGKHYIYSGEYEEALRIYNEVLKEAKTLKKDEYIVRANNAIGEIYYYKNKQNKAIEYGLKGKSYAKKIQYVDGLLDSIILICRLEASKGNVIDVIKNVNKAIGIAKKNGKKEYLGTLYNLLGIAFYYSGNIDKAKEKYKESIEAFYNSRNTLEITKPMNNIANIYSEHYRDDEKAMKYYSEGLDISTKYGYLEVKKVFLYNIGEVYLRKHDFKNAKKYIKKSKELAIDLGDNILEIMANITLGKIYLTIGDYGNAYNNYIEIVEEVQDIYLKDIELIGSYYNFLGEFNFKFGQWEKALKYTEKAIVTCENFKLDEYLESKARLILIEYFSKGFLNIESIENIIEEYITRSLYDGLRIKYLKFAAISLIHGNKDYAKELLERDEAVKEKFSSEYVEFIKKLLILNIDNKTINSNRLRKIEVMFKDSNLPILQLYSNIALAFKFDKSKCYFKSLNYFLETLDTLYRLIKRVPHKTFQISFIKSHKGDLIKNKIENIMKYAFSKEVKTVYLSDLKEDDDIESYFETSEIFELINDEEFEKISNNYYFGLNSIDEIDCLESLLENFTDDYEQNLHLILKYISMETYAQEGFILSFNKETGQYHPIVSLKKNDYSKSINESILKAASRNRNGLLIKNSLKDLEDNIFGKLLPSNTKALICVPVIKPEIVNEKPELERRKGNNTDRRIIGYIYIETSKIFNRFDEKRLKLINTISYLVFLNIENSKLKTLSTIDKMTGTFTRKYFDLLFKEFMELVTDNNETFGLIMIDIDKFKNINDTYGHRKGDEILRIIGNTLRENIRSTDIIGRYGGEEFIIVLKDINEEEAKFIAEKLRRKVESLNISNGETNLTVSIGLAMYPTDGQFKEELIEKADQALYCAKEGGRNKVIKWHPHIASTINRVDRLAGIVSGNMAQDQRRVLAMLDMVELIKLREKKDKKIYEFLGRLIEILDSEYGVLMEIDENENVVKSYGRKRFDTEWIEVSEININNKIVNRVMESRKGEFLIDWETVNNIDMVTGTPNWQSVIVTPLIFEGKVKGVVYLSVPMREKEFDYNCYNLVNTLCGIFASVV